MLSRRHLLLGVSGLLLPRPVRAEGQDMVRLPIGLTAAGMAHVPVSIGSRGPYRFIIDTGSQMSGISAALALQLGLKAAGQARVSGIGGSRLSQLYRVEDFSVGTVFRQSGMTLLGFDALPFREGQGLLGARFLTMLPSELDFTAREIRVHRHAPDFSGYTFLDSAGHGSDGRAVVQVTLDGQRLVLMVDTGATAEIGLNGGCVSRLHLWDRYPQLASGHTRDAAGFRVPHRFVKAPDLRLGGYRVESTPVRLTAPDIPNRKGETTDGVIGIRTLRRFGLCFADGRLGLRTPDGATVLPYLRPKTL